MRYDHYGPSDLAGAVEKAVDTLTPHATEFDSIAVRGVSGVIVGAPVSILMGKPLIIVRKDDELSHAHNNARRVSNGRLAGRRYLVLDDFIITGATIREIEDQMTAHTPAQAAAWYLYGSDSAQYTIIRPNPVLWD